MKLSKYMRNIEHAFFKMKINDVENPHRNHPLHDSATVFSYEQERFHIAVTFDGVSESREKDRDLVNISRELEWDIEAFCRKTSPEDIHDIADWFKENVENEKYKNLGATTISLLRYDFLTNTVDGICVGDSPALLCRSVNKNGGEIIEAQILSAFHSVANDPGIITRQWRYGQPLELTVFSTPAPDEFESLFLVTLSDGYGKLSDSDVVRFVDDDLQDSMVSMFYPDFARVYLPEKITSKFPHLIVDSEGSVSFSQVSCDSEIRSYLSEIYGELTLEEKRKAAMVDLDTAALYDLYKNPSDFRTPDGSDADAVLSRSHPSLAWMLGAPYNDAKDESGLDDYLREYIIAELFVVSMLEELYFETGDSQCSLQKKLKNFFDSLDPVGDDFSVALMKISR
ncbi:MAG: hypothetical protein JXR95_05820 [Deltaproteobacteria bacterium]|nr:hypothetical protein [Deltaproteobacteria bacterium]